MLAKKAQDLERFRMFACGRGTGHVNAVRSVLEELDFNIPVYGMVKDDNHRTRGLVTGEREFDLSKDIVLLRFVTAIQDEAHRLLWNITESSEQKGTAGLCLTI